MVALADMDGEIVRRWFRLAADALGQTRSAIDALNVFPVPDSDTGTNLHLTLLSAADAVDALAAQAGPVEIWRAATQGAMLGACGNSGTIVSQLLRGLGDICGPASPCDGAVVARAFEHAAALARAAVSRPAEGTVLTVADAAARAAAEFVAADAARSGAGDTAAAGLADVVAAAAVGARRALAGTQQQLAVLAANGVVDAGAAGLCVLLDALNAAITGAGPQVYEVPGQDRSPSPAAAQSGPAAQSGSYGYEVTYLLQAPAERVGQLRDRLDALGDSLVIVGGEGQWHVHVHVPDAGAAIEEGMRAGTPHRITVSYLGEIRSAGGHRVVAIADGPTLAALLSGAGALVVRHRDGDPPTPAALRAAFRQAGERVIIVPNGNSVAALAPAVTRLREEGIEVSVLAVRSPLQALAALAVHDPQRDFLADAAAMSRAAASMRFASVRAAGTAGSAGPAGPAGLDASGAVTESVIGLVAGETAVRSASQADAAVAAADLLLAGGAELVTLMAGEGAQDGLAELVAWHVRQVSPAAEIVSYDGGPADVILLIGAE
jgi:DAK2 domain fusion protein YloV